ncbi:ABC-2 type transport system ATP-binding protein [Saccharothrix ecbatanensis]|uniref:ABC-2 type transport system ATP-binding protein n=1 Tax=Saccharothrix ecbatanensis TaxID=1105145 RepID=A0A7W9HKH5_9PSEU|nr:ATP-binding cassette domain-containing protein [Saccharothrix ecbatanensis]MBB5803631.1 ABC-2 type transport system ATP-binding protein [Saccharothrix ecbatanensis]
MDHADTEALAIEAVDVTKKFGKVTALDGVSIGVPRGSVLGLLGHNGAGKTTLVNILTTMFAPTSGSARVAGFDVRRQGEQVRKRIGLTGQYASVDEDMTGLQNLVMIARLLGADRAQARRRAEELLDVFNIAHAGRRKVSTYSGGMRRRLDLGASLVGRPEVVFLDEPTTGLDPASRTAMWEIVQGLVRDGTTLLLTTQYLEEADRLADWITVLSKGKVVATGTSAALKAEIGQRTIIARLDDPSVSGIAVEAVRRLGLSPAYEPDRYALVISGIGSKDLARVVRALDDEHVELAELTLTEPTLDEVYLAVTDEPPAAAA